MEEDSRDGDSVDEEAGMINVTKIKNNIQKGKAG